MNEPNEPVLFPLVLKGDNQKDLLFFNQIKWQTKFNNLIVLKKTDFIALRLNKFWKNVPTWLVSLKKISALWAAWIVSIKINSFIIFKTIVEKWKKNLRKFH